MRAVWHVYRYVLLQTPFHPRSETYSMAVNWCGIWLRLNHRTEPVFFLGGGQTTKCSSFLSYRWCKSVLIASLNTWWKQHMNRPCPPSAGHEMAHCKTYVLYASCIDHTSTCARAGFNFHDDICQSYNPSRSTGWYSPSWCWVCMYLRMLARSAWRHL